MIEGYERFKLTWQGHTIEVSYQRNWLNSGWCHLELRSTEPLPVTATGYRSCFIVLDDTLSQNDLKVRVLAWLDDAATKPKWQRFLAENRQLKLF